MNFDPLGDPVERRPRSHAEVQIREFDASTLPSALSSATAADAVPILGDDCLVLAGPTAAGKTAIAIQLAQRVGAEIVSVDSMAVYRGLDIGTAKPTAEDRFRVPHHGIDLVEACEPFSVAAWLAAVSEAVDSIRGRGHRVLFVGGTPLYLKALREGLAALPATDPALRHGLERQLRERGSVELHRRLAQLDPAAAERVHPHDARRVIRGIEINLRGGSQPRVWSVSPRASSIRPMVLDVPRRLLADRIDRRVERMFTAGLVDEVQRIEAAGGIGPTARQAAGYREVLEMLAGRMSIGEAIDATKRRTRQLAKRQLTWFRGFRDAVWISA